MLEGVTPIAVQNAVNNPTANSENVNIVKALKQLINAVNNNPNLNPKKLQLPEGSVSISGDGSIQVTPHYGTSSSSYPASVPGTVSGLQTDQQTAKNVHVGDINVSGNDTLKNMSPKAIANAVNNSSNPDHNAVVKALKGIIDSQNKGNDNFNPEKLHLPQGSVSINPKTGSITVQPTYGNGTDNHPTEQTGTISGAASDSTVAASINTNLNLTKLANNPNPEVDKAATYLASKSAHAIEQIISAGASNSEYQNVVNALKVLIDSQNTSATNPNFNPDKLQITQNSAAINAQGQLTITPEYGFNIQGQALAKCKTGTVTGTLSASSVANSIKSSININSSDKELNGLTPQGIAHAVNNPDGTSNVNEGGKIVSVPNKTIIDHLKGLINSENQGNPNYNPNDLHLPPGSVKVGPDGKLKITPSYGNGTDQKT